MTECVQQDTYTLPPGLQEDTYTAPLGSAVCPRCAAAVAVTLDRAAVWLAGLFLRCPGCGGRWNEQREEGRPITRQWMTAPAAEGRSQ